MRKILAYALLLVVVQSCRKEEDLIPEETTNTYFADIPEFYGNGTSGREPQLVLLANATSRLRSPQDLAFNTDPKRMGELWVVNKDEVSTGGSTVMYRNLGTVEQTSEWRRDGNAWHFMSNPSAISFSRENHNWATSHNILDANHRGGDFTGPSLWSSDLDVYAKYHGQGTNGSHLDMLHGSPFSMGIEAHKNNAFWVFDGLNRELVFYDFVDDHGPGMHDHSDGVIRRYRDFELTREPEVPSHLKLDTDRKWLYIVDGGAKRILKMDVTTGAQSATLPLRNENLAEHSSYQGADWRVLIESNSILKKPCGIELKDQRLFVSDYESGIIHCFDAETGHELGKFNTGKPGITGISIGPDAKIYFVNALTHELWMLDPR